MAGRGHARHIREQQLVFWTERGSSYRGHCGRLLLGSDPASAAPQTSAPPTWMEEHYSRPWRQVGSSGEAVLCDHPTPATVGGRSGDGGETQLPAGQRLPRAFATDLFTLPPSPSGKMAFLGQQNKCN